MRHPPGFQARKCFDLMEAKTLCGAEEAAAGAAEEEEEEEADGWDAKVEEEDG